MHCFWLGPPSRPCPHTNENLECCLQINSESSTSVVWDNEDSSAASETDGAPAVASDGQAQTSAASPDALFADSSDPLREEGGDSSDPFPEEGADSSDPLREEGGGDQDSAPATADSPAPSLRESKHDSEHLSAETPSPTARRKYTAAYTYQVGEGMCVFERLVGSTG